MIYYKLVVRDKNGKVKQIHEVALLTEIAQIIDEETKRDHSVTITRL